MLNALRAARATVDAEPSAVVLICAVELCSLHYQYGGEAGQVGGQRPFRRWGGGAGGPSHRHGESHWRVVSSGSFLVPDADEA